MAALIRWYHRNGGRRRSGSLVSQLHPAGLRFTVNALTAPRS